MKRLLFFLALIFFCACNIDKPCSNEDVKKEVLSLFKSEFVVLKGNKTFNPNNETILDVTDSIMVDSLDDIFSNPTNDNKCNCEGIIYYHHINKDLNTEQKDTISQDYSLLKEKAEIGYIDCQAFRMGQNFQLPETDMFNIIEREYDSDVLINNDSINIAAEHKLQKILNDSNNFPNVRNSNDYGVLNDSNNANLRAELWKQIIYNYNQVKSLKEEMNKIENNPKGWNNPIFYKQDVKYEVKKSDDGKIYVELYK
ncbi:MAG TPA: hypothetical protein VNG53_01285 [Bacteroidia bacterium]|nr:hypothetical protein [Bacteroidia bacterium]